VPKRVVVRYAREVPIETWVANQARGVLGIENIKLGSRYNGGWPDRIFFIPGGRPLCIEFKRPGEEPDERQKEIHRRLRALGYAVEVHDDRDAALESVRRAAEVGPEPGSGKGDEVPPGARRRRTLRRSGMS
jgi:hypothetical protein